MKESAITTLETRLESALAAEFEVTEVRDAVYLLVNFLFDPLTDVSESQITGLQRTCREYLLESLEAPLYWTASLGLATESLLKLIYLLKAPDSYHNLENGAQKSGKKLALFDLMIDKHPNSGSGLGFITVGEGKDGSDHVSAAQHGAFSVLIESVYDIRNDLAHPVTFPEDSKQMKTGRDLYAFWVYAVWTFRTELKAALHARRYREHLSTFCKVQDEALDNVACIVNLSAIEEDKDEIAANQFDFFGISDEGPASDEQSEVVPEEEEDPDIAAIDGTIEQLVQKSRTLLLLGDPGAGKTTMLRHVGVTLAKSTEAGVDAECLVPIFLSLKRCESLRDLEMRIRNELPEETRNLEKPLPVQLESAHFALLLDGLNEIRDFEVRKAIAGEIGKIASGCPRNRFIVSSRSGIIPEGLDQFAVYRLQKLSDPQMESYLQKAWGGLNNPGEKVSSLKSRQPKIWAWGRTPFYLSILARTVEQCTEKLPDSPGTLLKEFLNQIVRREIGAAGTTFDPREAKELLQALAWLAFSTRENNLTSFSQTTAENLLQEFGSAQDPRQTLDRACGLAIITGNPMNPASALEFAHEIYQEFLAAHYLASHPAIVSETIKNEVKAITETGSMIEIRNIWQKWEEPLVMFTELTGAIDRELIKLIAFEGANLLLAARLFRATKGQNQDLRDSLRVLAYDVVSKSRSALSQRDATEALEELEEFEARIKLVSSTDFAQKAAHSVVTESLAEESVARAVIQQFERVHNLTSSFQNIEDIKLDLSRSLGTQQCGDQVIRLLLSAARQVSHADESERRNALRTVGFLVADRLKRLDHAAGSPLDNRFVKAHQQDCIQALLLPLGGIHPSVLKRLARLLGPDQKKRLVSGFLRSGQDYAATLILSSSLYQIEHLKTEVARLRGQGDLEMAKADRLEEVIGKSLKKATGVITVLSRYFVVKKDRREAYRLVNNYFYGDPNQQAWAFHSWISSLMEHGDEMYAWKVANEVNRMAASLQFVRCLADIAQFTKKQRSYQKASGWAITILKKMQRGDINKPGAVAAVGVAQAKHGDSDDALRSFDIAWKQLDSLDTNRKRFQITKNRILKAGLWIASAQSEVANLDNRIASLLIDRTRKIDTSLIDLHNQNVGNPNSSLVGNAHNLAKNYVRLLYNPATAKLQTEPHEFQNRIVYLGSFFKQHQAKSFFLDVRSDQAKLAFENGETNVPNLLRGLDATEQLQAAAQFVSKSDMNEREGVELIGRFFDSYISPSKARLKGAPQILAQIASCYNLLGKKNRAETLFEAAKNYVLTPSDAGTNAAIKTTSLSKIAAGAARGGMIETSNGCFRHALETCSNEMTGDWKILRDTGKIAADMRSAGFEEQARGIFDDLPSRIEELAIPERRLFALHDLISSALKANCTTAAKKLFEMDIGILHRTRAEGDQRRWSFELAVELGRSQMRWGDEVSFREFFEKHSDEAKSRDSDQNQGRAFVLKLAKEKGVVSAFDYLKSDSPHHSAKAFRDLAIFAAEAGVVDTALEAAFSIRGRNPRTQYLPQIAEALAAAGDKSGVDAIFASVSSNIEACYLIAHSVIAAHQPSEEQLDEIVDYFRRSGIPPFDLLQPTESPSA